MRIRTAAAIAAAVAALAAPASAEEYRIPLTCEGVAGAQLDAGAPIGVAAACYSDEGFHSNCVVFTEERYDPPQNGVTRSRKCYVNVD